MLPSFPAVVSDGRKSGCGHSCPAEFVLDADDVVFAEIGTSLYLDQLQLDLAGVGQAMDTTEWQVDRLVFVEYGYGSIDGDFCRAANDNPVLGPMVVLL